MPVIKRFIFSCALLPNGKYVGQFAVPGDRTFRLLIDKETGGTIFFDDAATAQLNAARVMRKFVNNHEMLKQYLKSVGEDEQ